MSDYDEVLHAAQSLTPDERLKMIARLWASLPYEVWTTPTEAQLVEAHRRMDRQGLNLGDSVPWPVVEQMLADCVGSSRPKVYSAPRRFDLSTIFVVTSAYGLLFAAMSALRFPAIASILIAAFITIVGIGQAMLYGGLKPRTASIVVGAAVCSVTMLGTLLWSGGGAFPPTLVGMFVYGIVSGIVLGYIAGALVGSVFLVSDKLRNRLLRHVPSSESAADELPFETVS